MDSEFENNIAPKTEGKKLSKVNCEINSVGINFLVDSGASANVIDIETEKISKVCDIGLETTNSKIYTFGSNNPSKLKGKFNATIKNRGFEVCTWSYVIDKLKTGSLLSKNIAEKLKILRIKNGNINARNL